MSKEQKDRDRRGGEIRHFFLGEIRNSRISPEKKKKVIVHRSASSTKVEIKSAYMNTQEG